MQAGRLPEFPTIEWYIHTTVDPSMRDAAGHHNSALFVQWVPYTLGRHDLGGGGGALRAPPPLDLRPVRARAPATWWWTPSRSRRRKIEAHFGITGGHIHHVDNTFGFADRLAYAQPLDGLYACSAGCHPAGSVIGAAGHNAAKRVLRDLGRA